MVTHCLCENISIGDIVAWCRVNGIHDADEAASALGCSTHCGMCRPFIEYALATGETVVPYPCPPIPPGTETR